MKKTHRNKSFSNRLKPSKKAETNGDRACKVLVFVRSLEMPVLKARQIKPVKKNLPLSQWKTFQEVHTFLTVLHSWGMMSTWRK